MVLVWRKSVLFWRRYARKNDFFLHFIYQWPWLLTFRPQIYSPSFSLSSGMLKCLRLSCLEKIWGTGQTGGQTDGVQHLMRPPGVGRITIEWIWTSPLLPASNMNMMSCGHTWAGYTLLCWSIASKLLISRVNTVQHNRSTPDTERQTNRQTDRQWETRPTVFRVAPTK